MKGGLSNVEVAEIYRRYGYLLLRRCRLLLRDPTAAEDVLQEAFVKIMRHGTAYAEAENKLRWLYRVVDNCSFDALKRRRQRLEVSDAHVPEPAGADAHPALVMRFEAAHALGRLSERDRTVAVLAFVDGLSQGQIASEVGWSRQTINKKLQGIRTRLEGWLGGRPGDEGGTR